MEYLTRDTPPLETINAEAKMCDAIRTMVRYQYSQLPIIQRSGDGRETCVGVVTALSFLQVLEQQFRKGTSKGIHEILQWPVTRFRVTGEPKFAQHSDEILDYIDALSKEDFVLVGSRTKCVSLVTNSDVVNFFRDKTEIFLLLREIETSLRYIISQCLPADQMKETLASLESARKKRNNHKSLSDIHDLSLDELKSVINTNWDSFRKYFKEKPKTNTQLDYIRELRNKILHFRSKITVSELTHIKKLRRNLVKIASSLS